MFAVLAMVSTASAVEQVWFVASGQNANSLVESQGSAGHSTTLLANDPGENSRWLIEMWVRCDGLNGGILGYDISMTTAESDTFGDTLVTAAPTGFTVDVGTVGADGSLLRYNATNYSTGYMMAGDFMVGSFFLNDIHEGDPEWDYIYAGCGVYGWGYGASGDYVQVQYGGAAAIEAWGPPPDNWAALPAISIHELPEPATLVLLGLGLVSLLRRR
jgi:hypothetical protein